MIDCSDRKATRHSSRTTLLPEKFSQWDLSRQEELDWWQRKKLVDEWLTWVSRQIDRLPSQTLHVHWSVRSGCEDDSGNNLLVFVGSSRLSFGYLLDYWQPLFVSCVGHEHDYALQSEPALYESHGSLLSLFSSFQQQMCLSFTLLGIRGCLSTRRDSQ